MVGWLAHAGRRTRRTLGRVARTRARGVGIVEFTLASLLFLPISIGTLDVGRAIFQYAQLTNAVREGARFGKTDPTNTSGISARVTQHSDGLALGPVNTTRSANPCDPSTCQLTVSAGFNFTFISADLINVVLGGALPSTITLSSTTTVGVE